MEGGEFLLDVGPVVAGFREILLGILLLRLGLLGLKFGLVGANFGGVELLVEGLDLLVEAFVLRAQLVDLGFHVVEGLVELLLGVDVFLERLDPVLLRLQIGAEAFQGGGIAGRALGEFSVGGVEVFFQLLVLGGERIEFALERVDFGHFGFEAGDAALEIVDFDGAVGGGIAFGRGRGGDGRRRGFGHRLGFRFRQFGQFFGLSAAPAAFDVGDLVVAIGLAVLDHARFPAGEILGELLVVVARDLVLGKGLVQATGIEALVGLDEVHVRLGLNLGGIGQGGPGGAGGEPAGQGEEDRGDSIHVRGVSGLEVTSARRR